MVMSCFFLWVSLSLAFVPQASGGIVHLPLTAMERGTPLEETELSPENLASAAKKLGFREIRNKLRNVFNVMYTMEVEIGTPPQKARLIVDTGSSDLWVNTEAYNPNASSTSNKLPLHPTLEYGQGIVSGAQYTDTICLGPFCVSQQSLISASSVRDIGNVGLYDGIVGLAYPALAVEPGHTIIQDIVASEQFHFPGFGMLLRGWEDPVGSVIAFGDVDELVRDTSIANTSPSEAVTCGVFGYNQVPMFWMLNVTAKLPQGRPIQFFGALDSGTSLIALPSASYTEVLYNLFGVTTPPGCRQQGGVLVCPCNLTLGSITLEFTGTDGKHLSIELTRDDLLQRIGGSCRLALQEMPSMDFWILGDVLLRKVYAVHDIRRTKVVIMPIRQAARARPKTDMAATVRPKMYAVRTGYSAQIGVVPTVLFSVLMLVGVALSAGQVVTWLALRIKRKEETSASSDAYMRL